MARGFSQSRSEIAGYGVSNKNPFGLEPKTVRTRFDGTVIPERGIMPEREVEIPSATEYYVLKLQQKKDIEQGKTGGPGMDRERNAKIYAYEEAQRQKEKEAKQRGERADSLRGAIAEFYKPKKPKKQRNI